MLLYIFNSKFFYLFLILFYLCTQKLVIHLLNVQIMVPTSVFIRFANCCEWFDPYFVKATSNGICFHALKKYSNYIVSTFSELDCTVSVRDSFDQNCYYYVIH